MNTVQISWKKVFILIFFILILLVVAWKNRPTSSREAVQVVKSKPVFLEDGKLGNFETIQKEQKSVLAPMLSQEKCLISGQETRQELLM